MRKPRTGTRQDAPGPTLVDVPLPYNPPALDRRATTRRRADQPYPPTGADLEAPLESRRRTDHDFAADHGRRISDRRYAELMEKLGGRAPDPPGPVKIPDDDLIS